MTYLKICGLRSQQDYENILKAGVDFIGFIFADSKRKVSPVEARKWIKSEHGPKKVGVFVNPTLFELERTLEHLNLDVIQLHGDEAKSFIQQIRETFDISIWKALPHGEHTLQDMEHYCEDVDGFVIDTKVKGQWGGTGIKFDWRAIPSYTKKARQMDKICFIAGGIMPSNVAKCLSYEPCGIDLSSGVEENERKSPRLINELLERMKCDGDHLSRS